MINIRILRSKFFKIILIMLFGTVVLFFVIKPYEYEMKIDFLETLEDEFLLEEDWRMITDIHQINNLEIDYEISTKIDFENYFMVVSKYKIKKLTYKKWKDDCNCGPPFGEIKFDKEQSEEGKIYFYKSEKTWLAQAL